MFSLDGPLWPQERENHSKAREQSHWKQRKETGGVGSEKFKENDQTQAKLHPAVAGRKSFG